MGSFFESFKKTKEEREKSMSNSEEELMNIMSCKNEIDHSTFIENIMDVDDKESNDNEEDLETLRKGSWFRTMPPPKED